MLERLRHKFAEPTVFRQPNVNFVNMTTQSTVPIFTTRLRLALGRLITRLLNIFRLYSRRNYFFRDGQKLLSSTRTFVLLGALLC